MPGLTFEIVSAQIKEHAIVPTLSFHLKITNSVENEEVYAAALKCQVMIEAVQRPYNKEEAGRLFELFGEPYRWGETLKSLFWTVITIPVPRFTGHTIVEVTLPCSEDMSVAAGKYFYAIQDGMVPLAFLFSGAVFYKGAGEAVQMTPVPWEKEADYKLPVSLWKEMMQTYFPNHKWLRISREAFDKICRYKALTAFPTLEACLESMADTALDMAEPERMTGS